MQPAKQIIILGGTSSASGGGDPPAAPILTLTTGETDNTPGFVVEGDLLVDDVVTGHVYSDSGLTTLVDTWQGTVTIAGTLTVTNAVGPLSDAPYWYNAVTARTGHATSTASNTESNTIDTTAPTLSSVVGTKTGQTTANLDFSTNETGPGYVVVTTSATNPTQTQVKTGKDHTGASAAFATSQTAIATGAQPTIGATGLTAGTTYYEHVMQEDQYGNQSTVSASVSFTTDSAGSWTATDNPANQAGPANSFTFTAAALGSTAASRITIVAVNTHVAVATAVTVGGLSATKAVEQSTLISGLQIWYVDTTSLGTTANIVVSSGTNMTDVIIMVGKLTGVQAAPTATNSNSSAAATSISATATVPSGGFGVAFANIAFDQTAASWTNATQDYESFLTVASGNNTLTLAHTSTSGSQTPTYGTWGVNQQCHIVIGCWGP